NGYNWVRLNATASDGSTGNMGIAVNMDVHNASAGVQDDWIFYGDSITEGAMGHNTEGGVSAFPQLINAQQSGNFPVEENGGIGFQTTMSALTYIDAQLALFAGTYAGLSYGTNDANSGCTSSSCLSSFYNNYAQLVQRALNAGKVPIVPTIPWGCTASLRTAVPLYNQQIQNLYAAYPQIVKGPDLYTFFQNNQGLISADCIHPSDTGMGAYRQQWANTMLTNVYGAGSAVTATPPTGTVAATPTVNASGKVGWSSG